MRHTEQTNHQFLLELALANQFDLNSKAYSAEWLEKGATGEFDYPVEAIRESVEFLNSFKGNWWTQNFDLDETNCKVELVDIYHFLLSAMLINAHRTTGSTNREVLVHDVQVRYERVVESAESAPAPVNAVRVFKDMVGGLCSDNYQAALYSMLRLLSYLGVDFQTFTGMYLAKSVLNQFRQDNGYKQKQYQKIWIAPATEDNYVLMQQFRSVSREDMKNVEAWKTGLYKWLEVAYSKVKGGR